VALHRAQLCNNIRAVWAVLRPQLHRQRHSDIDIDIDIDIDDDIDVIDNDIDSVTHTEAAVHGTAATRDHTPRRIAQ
jgi:hypothetical protein